MRTASEVATSATCRLLAMTLCAAIGIQQAHAQTASWLPSKPIEIVVGVAPGGGVDRTARFLQKIIQERRLVPTPVNVINKPGGGSTIAWTYLLQRTGDAHYYEIVATSLLTNHITGRTAISHRDFTPVVNLYDEYLGFAVPNDSPITDGKQLVAAFRDRIESLPIGIASSAGNTNHIAAGIVARAAGAEVRKLKVVVFNSGGESTTALLGGHVALVVTPAANLIPHMQNGRMRVIAVSAPKRLAGALAVVPTWKELGVNAVVSNWRPIVGAKGWSPAQIAYWEGVFGKVVATDEWMTEVQRAGGVSHFMGSRALGEFFDKEYAEFRTILGELGLAK